MCRSSFQQNLTVFVLDVVLKLQPNNSLQRNRNNPRHVLRLQKFE